MAPQRRNTFLNAAPHSLVVTQHVEVITLEEGPLDTKQQGTAFQQSKQRGIRRLLTLRQLVSRELRLRAAEVVCLAWHVS